MTRTDAGEPDSLQDLLGLASTWAAVQRVFSRALQEADINFEQACGLRAIAEATQPFLLHQLAIALVQQPQSVTSLVDRLERLGWARRVYHELPDRRGIRVELTAAGRAKYEEMVPLLGRPAATMVRSLGDAQRARFGAGLSNLYEGCRSQPGVRLPSLTEVGGSTPALNEG